MKKKLIIVAAALLLVIISVFAGLFFSEKFYYNDRIAKGFYIGKVYFGGMTREEAIAALSTMEADDVAAQPLSLVMEEKKRIVRYEYYPSQVGAKIRVPETVDDAIVMSQGGNYIQKVIQGFKSRQMVIQPKFEVFDEDAVGVLLDTIHDQVKQKSESAKFYVVTVKDKAGRRNKVEILDETDGRELIADKTEDDLKSAIQEGKTESKVFVKTEIPKVTAEMLEKIPSPEVIGSYTTYYGSHDSPNRIHNIYLVSSFVDDTYLMPNEIFSLLKPIGDFTAERGFKEAYVIIKDELVPELGGGSCQIATTLYNSVMFADLKVLSRRCHGIYFSIYPLGRDATVYPPNTDLRFKNNTGYPIVIQAIPFKKGLTFRIYGVPTGKTVYFTNPKVTYQETMITTEDARTGKMVTKKLLGPAFHTLVTRTVKQDGKVIMEEKIKSFYKLSGDKQKVKIRRKEPR